MRSLRIVILVVKLHLCLHIRKKESEELYIYGTHVCKNLGSLNAQGNRVYDGDFIFIVYPGYIWH